MLGHIELRGAGGDQQEAHEQEDQSDDDGGHEESEHAIGESADDSGLLPVYGEKMAAAR